MTDIEEIPAITPDMRHCPTCGQAVEPMYDEELESLELTAPGMERELARALERTCIEMGWAIRTRKGVTFDHVATALLVRLTSGTG